MTPALASIEQLFDAHIRTLALTLRPGTVAGYSWAARRFLSYLRATFPDVRHLEQLRRDPHLLGWFRGLCEQRPPLSNKSRADLLRAIRRLLHDLADNGHSLLPDLIRRQDFPPQPRYLPRPLSSPDDSLLQQEWRRTGDLPAYAFLLIRATGIRIGECIDLALDCLRPLGPDQWALHVPLGKLHTERLVPVDAEVRQIVTRILVLRTLASPSPSSPTANFLLPRRSGHDALYQTLVLALTQAAKRAGCSCRPTPHQLRHTFASEMVRLGVSLPALMQLLGAQRHSHDLAVCSGHPTGLAARVPRGTPAWPTASCAGTHVTARRSLRQSTRYPSSHRCRPPPHGNVPSPTQR